MPSAWPRCPFPGCSSGSPTSRWKDSVPRILPSPFDAYFLEELIPRLAREHVSHVGLSLTFLNQAFATFRLAFLLEQHLPSVQRLLGGPLVACWQAVGASLTTPAFQRFHRIIGAADSDMEALAVELGGSAQAGSGVWLYSQ